MKLKLFLLGFIPLALMACMETTSPNQPSPTQINNSDPRKANYAPSSSDATQSRLLAKKQEEQKALIQYQQASVPLNKANTTEYVGYLSFDSVTCQGWSGTTAWIFMHDESTLNGSWLTYKNISSSTWNVATVNGGVKKIPWWYASSGYWTGVSEPNYGTSTQGTRFEICKMARSAMTSTLVGYAVFRMSSACPSNSYPFSRILDNEDDNNANASYNNISPSYTINGYSGGTTGITRLEFCYVRPTASFSIYPPWYGGMGVFASPEMYASSWNRAQIYYNNGGLVLIDDEDNNNVDSWDWKNLTQADIDYIQTYIMQGATETHMGFQWADPIPVGKLSSGSNITAK